MYKYDKELQDIIDKFFDGTLNNNKERRIKKSNIIVDTHNNQNTFPPTSVSLLTISKDTLSLLGYKKI